MFKLENRKLKYRTNTERILCFYMDLIKTNKSVIVLTLVSEIVFFLFFYR